MRLIRAWMVRAVVPCCVMVLASVTGIAQLIVPPPEERPDLWTVVQDSVLVSLVDGSGTVSPDLVSGAYSFRMPYDSTCTTEYLFTEPWLNGKRLTLDRWFRERAVHADDDLLSFNSRTKGFRVKTGDTVSCYREIDWKHPLTGYKDTVSYFSRDTLSFAVELVDAVEMTRVALIDSICIMPQMPRGSFRFYGHRNAMAVAKYVVPSWMNGDSVCMRVRVYARGSGEYHFTRTDHIIINCSVGTLGHPVVMADLELLRNCCWTPIPLPKDEVPLGKALWATEEKKNSDAGLLSVRQTEGGKGDVKITLAPAPDLGELSIVVFDAQGNQLASPFSGPVLRPHELPYHFPASGAYIIGLIHDGRIIETTKITVTR